MESRIALGVEYDGSRYYGFQKQKSTEKTIQGWLENATSKAVSYTHLTLPTKA